MPANAAPTPDRAPPSSGDCDYLIALLSDVFQLPPGSGARVLDLGCGQGRLVSALRAAGYLARGTDFEAALPRPRPEWLVPIAARTGVNATISYEVTGAYVLPFESGSLDVVVSTSVLEHVKPKADVFREVHRVLAPGGVTIHSFPGRYYLPREPHLGVPLVPAVFRRPPRWWLGLWALAGVRNPFQAGKAWRTAWEENVEYCRDSLAYASLGEYEALLTASGFRDVRTHFSHYIARSPGGYARLLRGLPLRRLVPVLEPLLRELRDTTLSAVR